VERIPYGSWKDIAPIYDDIVAADAKIIDVSTPRPFWTGGRQLRGLAALDEQQTEILRLTAYTSVNRHAYRLALL
jgi:hypothetical protein